jgi:hypothetical protein
MQTRALGIAGGLLAMVAGLVCGLLLTPRRALAAPAERFLHVQVSEANQSGENVNVNLPLEVAEKVLPTIDRGPLHQGRVTLNRNQLNGIDLPAILEAIRTSPDNKLVTVTQKDENVEVSKSGGNIIVHVNQAGRRGDNVSVTVPISVATALFSTAHQNEIDVAAALQALDKAGDSFLVTVENATEHVRVWVDGRGSE